MNGWTPDSSLRWQRIKWLGETLMSTREITQAPEPIIPMFKKRKGEKNWGEIQTKPSFYLFILNRRLFLSKAGCKSQAS